MSDLGVFGGSVAEEMDESGQDSGLVRAKEMMVPQSPAAGRARMMGGRMLMAKPMAEAAPAMMDNTTQLGFGGALDEAEEGAGKARWSSQPSAPSLPIRLFGSGP